MKQVMSIINLYENEEALRELTRNRPLATVPFAGRYRIIDFILSGVVNAGVRNVGILLKHHQLRSLTDHLRSGKEWDLARKRDGLFLLPPAAKDDGAQRQGDIAGFYDNLDFFAASAEKYILIAHSHMICNLDFSKVMRLHENSGADITMLYKEEDDAFEDFDQSVLLDLDEQGWVCDIAVRPQKRTGNKVALEMYIINKDLLVDLVQRCYARGGDNLLMDGIIRNLKEFKICSYAYRGYLANIHSVKSYYRNSLNLLKQEKWQELFFKSGPIYTKTKDEGPARYKEGASVSGSMVASGCIIEGRVENSILFRGVRVEPGAVVRDSVIMQRGHIREGCLVEQVICDKNVTLSPGTKLKGERQYPLVIEKGSVI